MINLIWNKIKNYGKPSGLLHLWNLLDELWNLLNDYADAYSITHDKRFRVAEFYPTDNEFNLFDCYWKITKSAETYHVNADMRPKGFFRFNISPWKCNLVHTDDITFEEMADKLNEILKDLKVNKTLVDKILKDEKDKEERIEKFRQEQEEAINKWIFQKNN